MPRLIAKSPCQGLLPVAAGTCRLTELQPPAITSVARTAGADNADFKAATGTGFPAPNRSTGRDGARAIWTGPDQCFWIGPPKGAIPGHALTDQSDAWAAMRLEGADARAVLARLVPVDLRPDHFKRGHTARTLLFHVTISVTRTAADAYDILCFRSMAATAVHELHAAMNSVAAQSSMAG